MFEDEVLPQRKPAMLERHVLDGWSVADLNAYIQALQEEIGRAKTVIDKKQGARGHADSFFRR